MAKLPEDFGQYTLIRRLGVGGMAEAYVARRRGPGDFEQYVCIKRILGAYQDNPRFVKHFLREASLVARLRHSNITQVLDHGEIDGNYYLALELVEGLDLRELILKLQEHHECLDIDFVVHIAVELAHALDFAHTTVHRGEASPILHRDISPSNVLVSVQGEVKLSDFGIAKAMNQASTMLTASGQTKGKTHYMAPEYAAGKGYGPEADLYALGITLFESLSAERPYEGDNVLDILSRALRGEHRSLKELRSDVPDALIEIVHRLIHPDARQRFASASELLDTLAEVPMRRDVRRRLGECVRELHTSSDGSMPHEGVSAATAGLTMPESAGFTQAVPSPSSTTSTAAPNRQRGSENHGTVSYISKKRSRIVRWMLLASALISSGALGLTYFYRHPPTKRLTQVATMAAKPKYEPVKSVPPSSPIPLSSKELPSNQASTEATSKPVSAIRARSAAKATLTVIVVPGGTVWIDNDKKGLAPVKALLAPGTYTVRAGEGEHSVSRTIKLRSGQSQRLVLRSP